MEIDNIWWLDLDDNRNERQRVSIYTTSLIADTANDGGRGGFTGEEHGSPRSPHLDPPGLNCSQIVHHALQLARLGELLSQHLLELLHSAFSAHFQTR